MNERLVKTGEVASLACFAAAGAFYAFSAGGHAVYAEQAKTTAVRHHEEQQQNENEKLAIVFEGLAVAMGINIAIRKPRSY